GHARVGGDVARAPLPEARTEGRVQPRRPDRRRDEREARGARRDLHTRRGVRRRGGSAAEDAGVTVRGVAILLMAGCARLTALLLAADALLDHRVGVAQRLLGVDAGALGELDGRE